MNLGRLDENHVLLSISEVAQTLRISPRTVWTLVHEQGLPHVRIGRRLLFSRASLESWIVERQRTYQ